MISPGHERRVERLVGVDDLVGRMAALSAPDLRTLLLAVARRRADALTAPAVLRRYEASSAFHPVPVDPAAYGRFEIAAIGALPSGFEPLLLAPVAPFGATSALGDLAQDRVVTTMSGSEVVSDSTNVLALECARRRRDAEGRRGSEPTRLAAGHRLLRPLDGAHFGLFALCTAHRDRGSFATQMDALREHLAWHAEVITRQAPALDLRIHLTDLSGGVLRDTLTTGVLSPLSAEYPGVTWAFDDARSAGRGYYIDACFAVDAVDRHGTPLNLSDGGFTDWTARLLDDRKERLLTSGLGSERLIQLCRAAAPH